MTTLSADAIHALVLKPPPAPEGYAGAHVLRDRIPLWHRCPALRPEHDGMSLDWHVVPDEDRHIEGYDDAWCWMPTVGVPVSCPHDIAYLVVLARCLLWLAERGYQVGLYCTFDTDEVQKMWGVMLGDDLIDVHGPDPLTAAVSACHRVLDEEVQP